MLDRNYQFGVQIITNVCHSIFNFLTAMYYFFSFLKRVAVMFLTVLSVRYKVKIKKNKEHDRLFMKIEWNMYGTVNLRMHNI